MLRPDFQPTGPCADAAADRRAEIMIPIMGRHLAGDPVSLTDEASCRASLLTAYAEADVNRFVQAAIAEARVVRGRAM